MEKKTIDEELIKKISNEGDSQDEFIVAIDFEYCDVTYSGYQIVSRSNIKILWNELQKDRQVYTPNMPGDWHEEYDISLLEDAFSIHSDNPDDVKSMRHLFGDYVGNTELLDMVLTPSTIDEELAKAFLDDPDNLNLSEATEITDGAAKSLSKYDGYLHLYRLTELTSTSLARKLAEQEGELWLHRLKELSDATAEILSKHQGDLDLSGLTELSDAAAESLSKHKGDLLLNGLTKLSDAAAESLSKHQGDLGLYCLEELSDAAAESLSKHQGDLGLYRLKELSEAAAESLSKHLREK